MSCAGLNSVRPVLASVSPQNVSGVLTNSVTRGWSPLPPWVCPGRRTLHHPLPCSPCFQRTCETGYACLTAISVEEVLAAARPWLTENS